MSFIYIFKNVIYICYSSILNVYSYHLLGIYVLNINVRLFKILIIKITGKTKNVGC